MVHQNGERTLVVFQNVLARWLAIVVARLLLLIRRRARHLDQAIIGRVLSGERVLVQHLSHHVGRRLADRQQKRLVRHVTAQTLPVDLQ